MKVLYLIRHAKSSWTDARLADIDRPLNPRGLRDAPKMATYLKERTEGKLDAIYSSPANRARSTAAYFGQSFNLTIHIEASIYEAWEIDLIAFIQSLDNQLNDVALFGHNPSFTTLANKFSAQPIDNVPTCGVVKIENQIEDWKEFSFLKGQVTAFYYPKKFKE